MFLPSSIKNLPLEQQIKQNILCIHGLNLHRMYDFQIQLENGTHASFKIKHNFPA